MSRSVYILDECHHRACVLCGGSAEFISEEDCIEEDTIAARLEERFSDDKSLLADIARDVHAFVLEAKYRIRILTAQECPDSYSLVLDFERILMDRRAPTNKRPELDRYRAIEQVLKLGNQSSEWAQAGLLQVVEDIVEGRLADFSMVSLKAACAKAARN